MPGTDPAEAMRVIAGELPDFPHLPELPARGPGADLTGRTAALLVDIPVEVSPRGWRLAEHPGRDLNRARSLLSFDLDVLEEVLDGYRGLVKVELCGPVDAGRHAGAAAHAERGHRRSRGSSRPDRLAAEGRGGPRGRAGQADTGGPDRRPVRRAGLARRGGRRDTDGKRAFPARPVEPEVLRERLAQVIGSPGLHGGAQLRSVGPVRPDPDGGGRCDLLRPQPATARRRRRDRRGRRGRAWAADRRGPGRPRIQVPGRVSPVDQAAAGARPNRR